MLGPAYRPLVSLAMRCGLRRWLRTPPRRVRRLLAELAPVDAGVALVRVGAPADGGYLLPDDLEGIAAVFSPGVGDNSAFEVQFAARGVPAFLLDGTVDGPAEQHPLFHFSRRMLGGATDGDHVTLPDWVAESVPVDTGDLVLQMDVEGAEYAALTACDHTFLQRFRIIAIELHYLDRLFVRRRHTLMARQLRKLLDTHACVHIHPNNHTPTVSLCGITVAPVAEFTFLRRDRLPAGVPQPVSTFPHPLDVDNSPYDPPVTLPPSMRR